jgi:LysM repeat protein
MHAPISKAKPAPREAPLTEQPLLENIRKVSAQAVNGIQQLFKKHLSSEKEMAVSLPSKKQKAGVKSPPVEGRRKGKATSKEKTSTGWIEKLVWLPKAMWGIAAIMVLMVAFLVLQFFELIPDVSAAASQGASTQQELVLPVYSSTEVSSLERVTDPKTVTSDRKLDYITRYKVQPLESVNSIAVKFDLKPDTVLWSNEKELRSDPNTIPVDSTLYIPPVDGVYYQWKKGDTLESVASKYKVEVETILTWPSNRLDLTDPQIVPGQYVMIPGGKGTPIEWVVTIPYASHSGANRGIGGQCNVTGYYPWSGGFIWPVTSHLISGNEYWAGHLGIDIGAYLGDPVWASSAGVVIWAGNMDGGYGNVVVLEHDNGGDIWNTVYAHLSAINVRCGQVVSQGQTIGAAGNSGNSTGPHLHYEVRQNGAFVNPHYVVSP